MKILQNPYAAWRCALVLGIILGCGTARAGIQASASLEPSEIRLGEAAQLNVTIQGSATAGTPEMPTVEGLEFQHVGQSTNVQFVNGVMSGGVTHIYQVLARKDGTFTIPSIIIAAGGETVKTQPSSLRVLKPSASYALPPASRTTSRGAVSRQNQTTPASSTDAAMIQLIYPQRDFYVGELVPTDLKVYLRQGLRIQGISLPTLSGTAFTVGKLGNNPEQGAEVIQGVPYTVLTWHTAVAAIKTGEHPLGAQIGCTILVADRSRRRPGAFGGGMFDDPFFDSFFGGVEQKQVTLKTDDATVKVLPLPSEGKPADFTGAIGRFDFSMEASPKSVTAGDPVTLKMKVAGTGNFDRVQAPEFQKIQGFKIYPPSSKFEPTSESGYAGEKFFEQMVVPQTSEVRQIPDLRFHFFDPEAHRYATLTASPIPLQVASGAPSVSQAALPPPTAPLGTPGPSKTSDAANLLPNKLEWGEVDSNMKPLVWNPWFWGSQSLPLLAWAIACGIACRKERIARDPSFARAISAHRTVRIHLEAMEKAMKQGNPAAFFHAARKALQERLGQQWGIPPETITLSDVEIRMQTQPSLAGQVRKVFETADAISYSGQNYRSETLREWKQVILETLKALEGA